MVIVRKHIGEELFFQILNKFGDSWGLLPIAAAEEVSLQTASEGGKRRCRRDVLRQTVPNTGCSDWKATSLG